MVFLLGWVVGFYCCGFVLNLVLMWDCHAHLAKKCQVSLPWVALTVLGFCLLWPLTLARWIGGNR